MGLLRQRLNYIAVDMPVPFPPSLHPVITHSRHVLVLLEAEVTGLRNAHALRAAVTNIAGKDRVFTLLNRADRPGGLPRATIVKALGAEPDMVIPDLGKGMTRQSISEFQLSNTYQDCDVTSPRLYGRSRAWAPSRKDG